MPRLLDLFCGAGGAAMGYYRAGFEVVGVDINPQPRYPFSFVQADALQVLEAIGDSFDAIHASPPCQRYSQMSSCRPGLSDDYPDLVAPTRELLERIGVPFVIENVPGAPLRNPVMLCGHMFDLELYRHRLFESSEFLWQPAHPPHIIPGSRAGHWKPGHIISVSGNCSPIALARRAMGIDWMNRNELAESIPPAFTEHIGIQLLEHMRGGSMKPGEFTPEAKELMFQRSLGECEVQWPNVCMQTVETFHHRRPRGRGGSRQESTSRVSNGLAICRGCHSFIETRERGKAIDLGFIVSQWHEPAFERVFYRHERWVWLADDGSIREEKAA